MLRRLAVTVGAGLLVLLSTAAPRVVAHGDHTYHHLCTLIALPWDANTRVPAPELPAIAGDGGATFSVNYTGFTSPAQTAFQRAVDIWAGLVSSPRPIRIRAVFSSLGPGVLGSAGATCHHANFSGASVSNTWFPNPLADRLSNTDIEGGACDTDDTGFEISASFSSTANWYYGTDGNPASGQYDFVSVVLHEIGHGLGFAGFGNVSSGQGTVLASGRPGIYDRFTVTEDGTSLLTGFTSPSAALATQMTQAYNSGNPRGPGVYFSGTHTNAANGSVSARLYTPSTWSGGSSYSHLDESTYPAGNANSLMTYAISSAEAIHHPGNVTLGLFKDLGWSTCPASLAATTANVSGAASSGSVALTIEPGCVWSAASQSSFLTISGSSTGTGAATVSYNVASNTTGSSRQGTLRISGVTYTVTQSANTNTITLTPSTLRFAGTNTAGTLSPLTPAQSMTITTTGSGLIPWTAAASQPWVQVTPSSGTGTTVVSVSIVNPGNVLGASTDVSATITVSSINAGNTPSATVALRLGSTGTFEGPIGITETPAQNATGVQGAIGVTGWVVDDVGVSKVEIFRECITGLDNPASCQTVLSQNVVLVGEAAFLPGARPDVEGAFSTYPQANRAGWGYLMLTSMLPNRVSNQAYGGQGALTIYAIATDLEGNRKILGRSFSAVDPTYNSPTAITMENTSIAKPFGAIDTPAQGATVSGVLANFGWALTPDSNTTGGEGGDILIPTNGSTMTVFIDSVPVAQVTYNQCRGSVGNPVLAGVYCNDDVANIFGNATPQAVFTSRSSNPTKHRNLDAGRSAIGSYAFDTSLLSNGLHTIAWSVTDSASRTEGIGSRFFNVLNSGTGDSTSGTRTWGIFFYTYTT
jgi:hypothetical protein